MAIPPGGTVPANGTRLKGMTQMKIHVLTQKLNERGNSLAEGIWVVEDSRDIDSENKSDQIWLRNHTTWALHNGRRVLQVALKH